MSSEQPPPSPVPNPPPVQLPPSARRPPPGPRPRSFSSTSFSFSRSQSQQTPLSRAAKRTNRLPRVPPPPPSPASQAEEDSKADEEVAQVLHSIGYAQYMPLFTRANLSGRTLQKLTNAELRDDLGIRVLRHRRELLSAFATLHAPSHVASVPEFGRILVHLSNVRTFHSWLRSGVQAVMFAGALVRLSPQLRPSSLTSPAAYALIAIGLVLQMYGIGRYWRVMGRVEAGGYEFQPDKWGTAGYLVLVLGVAAVCVYIVLREGFWPR